MILVEIQHFDGDVAADVECGSVWWRAGDLTERERVQIDRHAGARDADGENGGNGLGELLRSFGFVRLEHRVVRNGVVGRQFDGDDSAAEMGLRLVRGWPRDRPNA